MLLRFELTTEYFRLRLEEVEEHTMRRQSTILSRTLLVGCAVLCAAVPVSAQRGARVLPRNLSELLEQSERILSGTVSSVRVERHPELNSLWTIVVTLRVDEVLKGQTETSFTFRQFIWDVRDRLDAAGYAKGQRLLLMMNRPSSLGLSSPAGLEQGRFRIVRDASGEDFAVNGAGNSGLLRKVAPELKKKQVSVPPALSKRLAEEAPGPLELRHLKFLVRNLAQGAKQ